VIKPAANSSLFQLQIINKSAVDFPIKNLCFNTQETVNQLAAATSCRKLSASVKPILIIMNLNKVKKNGSNKLIF
jgi:hypothetical protein